ncbi:hypothetical protein COU00_04210 [Candidatus Falkowbacteria bacterium CG10_big_fil_rev_8_21_14_0_10_43_11]|uniref:Phosphoenolpyruvate synthase n=1 Tax=Candidatus Falkowbacteria bacterium CG10_big_fil_rev_8_21_14_0_10_43_11 TaxID=1974568 RepID=A0A2M6WL24_9BACT|nr:MAG: hypothetical protein COU00_04210 [Candidatus Falkowbacteria bacterium CG10_big_fil_rev_8_21_14_0_10_43_11]
MQIVMELLRNFEQLNKNDVFLAGGKGASLGEMIQVGISVPPGFVILSTAFEKFLEKTDLNIEIDSILHSVNHKKTHTIENASEKIKALILGAEMPGNISEEIQKFFKNLNTKYVAIRSSATAEDSASAAWAGQLESYLNTIEENLLENVKKCWASLFTPRAIFYRFEKDLHKQKISVAVVVQKMVESEMSGVAFSVHPITQDKNQLIIEAGFGLGEAIVAGHITPDSYVVEKTEWRILDKNINFQKKMLVVADGGGSKWQELTEKQSKRQVLFDSEILDLAKLIVKIERRFGFPVDVEWAKKTDKFYVLQSRPITTLATQRVQEMSTEYVRIFESTGMPFLINSITIEHYKPLNAVAIFRDNLWTTYLPKKVQAETLKYGIELFGHKNKFMQYVKDFEEYKKRSIKLFDDVCSREKIFRNDLENFFNLISELWLYYRKTEFFYVDDAYRKSQQDKTTAKNLRHLEEIKNSGRGHLNKMIFGDTSYLSKALKILSKQFEISPDNLFWYSKDEVMGLYEKKSIDEMKIRNRKFAYVFLIKNGTLITFQGEQAKDFISSFIVEVSKDEIRGIVANPGKVRAKAKVMKYGADTFDKVSQIIKKMKNGDILVAETTSPEIIAACKKASAILTNQGGLLSHAAIVSRELNIPCIVGLNNITHLVSDGDILDVDAINGTVRILK